MHPAQRLTDAVSAAVLLLDRQPPPTRAELLALGATHKLSKLETYDLAQLVATAFAKRYYSEEDFTFGDNFMVAFPDEQPVQRYFMDSSIYRIASQLAANTPREACKRIAELSPEHLMVEKYGKAKLAGQIISIGHKTDLGLKAADFRK